ncbi:MAG: PD40 domain-containing protein [Candidatus Aminicenantes bacterium]|nr:MAG: PD40 domain-containing protein [Candidatus Aminicenantes bacterium]
MKKIRFIQLAMLISMALVSVIGSEASWFTAIPLENSASDSDKLAEKHFGKAIGLLKQENYQEAIEEYNKVIKLLPDSLIAQNAQYWIGQTYFRMGELNKALSVFGKLIKDYPGSAIIPVTQLMIARVQQAKESKKLQAKKNASLDKKVIVDPKTGAKYTKIGAISGKRDVATYSRFSLSPNGKFLLHESIVIPLKGEEPFDLVDTEAWRGVWSPDGKKVAFYSGKAICVIPVSPETGRPAGPAKEILEGKYEFQAPVSWAPDSERVVFMKRDEKTQGDIWTLSIKDGTLRQITNDPEVEFNPSWSSDGKTIAYNWGDSEIRVISAEGGKSRKIADIKYSRYISWSPDGKWLLYRSSTRRGKLHLVRLSDEYEFDIDLPKEVGDFFSWSPDGKKMFFYNKSYDYTNVLKVVSASGGPSFQLGRELKLMPYTQFWSPDSKMIITEGLTQEPINSGVWIIPLAGAEAIPLKLDVSFKGKLHSLSLSPDRKRGLFSVERADGKEDLYVIPISLKEARSTGPPVLVFSEWDCWHGLENWSWSSDGKKLAVIHKGDLWVASAEKDRPVQITKTSENEILPEWSPVGEMIVYVVEVEQGKMNLQVISASGGKPTKILDNCAHWSHAWSPDGKELFAESNGIILAIPIDGRKARKILDLKEQGVADGAGGLCWLPDGKHIAFRSRKMGRSQPSRIFIVPAKGGKVIELASDDDGWKDWIYPSPDGKWISYNTEDYVKTRPEGTIWEVDVEELLKGVKKQKEK